MGCYEFAAKYWKAGWSGVDHLEPIKVLELQAKRGIDMITVHASTLKAHLKTLEHTSRLIPMTSKGGGIIANYIQKTGRENPYYEKFDQVLDIFSKYEVTLSLGTTFRPASICDRWDSLMISELETMAELTERAITKNVPVIIEGIGHADMGAIPTYVRLAKSYCSGVPYRVLPMATDAALGFDHISGAIGGAVAVGAGADAITCISRAEHIGLPTKHDFEEAIISTKIAAHCGEIMKLGDMSKDFKMSKSRWKQGCKGHWEAAIVPSVAQQALAAHERLDDHAVQCGMCGNFCGIVSGTKVTDKSKTQT